MCIAKLLIIDMPVAIRLLASSGSLFMAHKFVVTSTAAEQSITREKRPHFCRRRRFSLTMRLSVSINLALLALASTSYNADAEGMNLRSVGVDVSQSEATLKEDVVREENAYWDRLLADSDASMTTKPSPSAAPSPSPVAVPSPSPNAEATTSPTVSLPTESPPTESPPTVSPPTASPPIVSPPTESPPTESPPTESPPTVSPNAPPSSTPTKSPTNIVAPTSSPSAQTTFLPTRAPTSTPSSAVPSSSPSAQTTYLPTRAPTSSPSSAVPSSSPNAEATPPPTAATAPSPIAVPRPQPTAGATPPPTVPPTKSPTLAPTATPNLPATPPPSIASAQCSLDLLLECRSQNGTPCDSAFPISAQCTDRPTLITMKFNGGGCSQSLNIQPSTDFQCFENQEVGPPATTGTYYIEAGPTGSAATFSGLVEVGGTFPLSENGALLATSYTFVIFPDANRDVALTQVSLNTDCVQGLYIGDKYGAGQVVEFMNAAQGDISANPQSVTFNYTVVNTGNINADLGSLVTTIERSDVSPGVTEDLTDQIAGRVVPPSQTATATLEYEIDLMGRKTYTIAADIAGQNGGTPCTNTAEISFDAGYAGLA